MLLIAVLNMAPRPGFSILPTTVDIQGRSMGGSGSEGCSPIMCGLPRRKDKSPLFRNQTKMCSIRVLNRTESLGNGTVNMASGGDN